MVIQIPMNFNENSLHNTGHWRILALIIPAFLNSALEMHCAYLHTGLAVSLESYYQKKGERDMGVTKKEKRNHMHHIVSCMVWGQGHVMLAKRDSGSTSLVSAASGSQKQGFPPTTSILSLFSSSLYPTLKLHTEPDPQDPVNGKVHLSKDLSPCFVYIH